MLGLVVETDPRWVTEAAGNLEPLLVDHAHCELKAAQNALALVARYGSVHPVLVTPLVALAQEEMDHLHAVTDRLAPGTECLPKKDPYAAALRQATQRASSDPLLDRLLVAALIEARSCERFQLLASHLPQAALRRFYRALMTSEARHYQLFRTLASTLFGAKRSRHRFGVLAAIEADIVRRLPGEPTIHG